MANPKSIFDQLASFPGGVNSGVDPLLLPKTQLAFALNATLRGDFFRQRPANQTIALSYASALIQTAFQSGYFQGAGYYKPDFGGESVALSIAGRLFLFTPDQAGGGTVTDISIPGDPNPPTNAQTWMTQAEQFLIVNDGSSLPLIYDGTSTRRSLGMGSQLGVVATGGGNPVPATGSTVALTLVNDYTGPLNETIYIDDATYVVVAVGNVTPVYAVVLNNINDTHNNTVTNGTSVVVQPALIGRISSKSGSTVYSDRPIPSYVTVGQQVNVTVDGSFMGFPAEFAGTITSINRNNNSLGLDNGIDQYSGNTGDLLIVSGGSMPASNVGTIGGSGFTVPAQGSPVNVTLASAYVGAIGQMVYIGTAVYQVTGLINQPPPDAKKILVENLTDTPGNIIPDGSVVGVPAAILSNLPELPAGRVLVYGMGRIWESMIDGISFLASDLVDGSGGSPAYNYRDSVFKITENDFLAGGGLFRVPGTVGDIKAMQFTAVLDASLGQGPLEVFTPTTVFSCQAPVDRTTWKNLVNPILTTALIGSGACSQTSVSPASGDLLFRSSDGLIRSLLMARLDFNQWGNTPISREVTRVLAKEDLSLLAFSTATVFDNRFLMGAQMKQAQRGVYSTSLVALNFDPISSLRGKDPSIYDGQWVGLNVLQLVSGFFNGVQRCFAICLSQDLAQIEIHEILTTDAADYDDGNTPITSYYESPVLFGPAVNQRRNYLRLVYGEISMDSIVGTVQFQAFYKPDQWPNWVPWHSWTQTFTPGTDPGFRSRVGLPEPDATVFDKANNRPLREGYNFQFKLTGSGKFRFLNGQFESVVIDQPEHLEPI